MEEYPMRKVVEMLGLVAIGTMLALLQPTGVIMIGKERMVQELEGVRIMETGVEVGTDAKEVRHFKLNVK